jgi:hypothetical protein
MMESKDIRTVFNDLQTLLMSDFTVAEENIHYWNSSIEEDIVQLRKFMNINHNLLVDSELKGLAPFNKKNKSIAKDNQKQISLLKPIQPRIKITTD